MAACGAVFIAFSNVERRNSIHRDPLTRYLLLNPFKRSQVPYTLGKFACWCCIAHTSGQYCSSWPNQIIPEIQFDRYKLKNRDLGYPRNFRSNFANMPIESMKRVWTENCWIAIRFSPSVPMRRPSPETEKVTGPSLFPQSLPHDNSP
jgi:hypothetical protein